MESKRTATTYFIPPGKFLLMENALGNPDLIQSSVSSDCRVTIVDLENFPLDDLEQWPTFRLISSDIKLKLGEGKYHIYIVVPAADNTESTSAFVSYNTRLVDRKGYAQDGTLLGKAGFRYYPCGTVSERGGNPSATTTPSGQGRVVEMDLGVTPTITNLPGNFSDLEEVFHIEKTDPSNPSSWLMTIVGTVKSMTARIIRVTSSLIFGSGENERPLVGVAVRKDATTPGMVSDTIIATTAWVDAQFEHMDDRYLSKRKDDRTPHNLGVGKSLSVGKKIFTSEGLSTDDFLEGASGASVYQDEQGAWHIETDNLKVRRKFSASDVDIQSTDHIGGQALLTAARMRVDYVLEEPEYYRCYFRKTDSDGNVIRNEWQPSDLAYCNTFNLERQSDGSVGNHYYWRKVVAVSGEGMSDTEPERTFGDETIRTADYHFVDLSRLEQEYAEGSSAPKSGDKVVHLGYSGDDDPERQSAIVIAGAGTGSPYIRIFQGIHNFTLPSDPEQLKPGDNRLSGRMSIKSGSTGWKNFEGLPEEIQKAANAIETIEYGKNNMLRNSGFTGDYLTAVLDGSTSLKDTSSMFSPSLKHWDYVNATAIEEKDYSESGKAVHIQDGGSISQTLYFKVIKGEKYIFSFRGKGGSVTYSVGGYSKHILMDKDWAQYVDKCTTFSDGEIFTLSVIGDCTLCELQLERGTVKSAWGISPLDNRSELAKYDSLTYLQAALKGDTVITGGLINTNLINMGMYDEESKMTKTTAGINGLYNEDRSIAFWAGGTSEQAAFTEATYLDNPNYIPTQEELNKMAKFVVTHGGRAILNDIILRGYIYALGGMFKGAVDIAGGKIKLNADGSGQLAEGAVEWNKYGIMYRKSHENVKWVNVSSEFSESMIIDLKKGTYLDVTEGLNPNPYILPDSEYDGVTLSLLYTHASRSNQPAVLSGNFKAFVKTDDGYTRVSGNELTLSEDGIEYELTYDSKETAWVYMGKGVSIEGNRIVLGKVIESKTDVQANSVAANSFVANGSYGLTKVVTIYGRDATYTLNFTAGILTGVNETYDS